MVSANKVARLTFIRFPPIFSLWSRILLKSPNMIHGLFILAAKLHWWFQRFFLTLNLALTYIVDKTKFFLELFTSTMSWTPYAASLITWKSSASYFHRSRMHPMNPMGSTRCHESMPMSLTTSLILAWLTHVSIITTILGMCCFINIFKICLNDGRPIPRAF